MIHKIQAKKKKTHKWVRWYEMVNIALPKTREEIKTDLSRLGLIDEYANATHKAYRLQFVKSTTRGEFWNRFRYFDLLRKERGANRQLERISIEIHDAAMATGKLLTAKESHEAVRLARLGMTKEKRLNKKEK